MRRFQICDVPPHSTGFPDRNDDSNWATAFGTASYYLMATERYPWPYCDQWSTVDLAICEILNPLQSIARFTDPSMPKLQDAQAKQICDQVNTWQYVAIEKHTDIIDIVFLDVDIPVARLHRSGSQVARQGSLAYTEKYFLEELVEK